MSKTTKPGKLPVRGLPVRRSATKMPADVKKSGGHSARAGSKQDAIIALLSQPRGATISVIMKATVWQQHSVRGFLAGVIRRKLGLTLESQKTGDERVYRIVAGKPSRSKSKTGNADRPAA